MNKQTVYAVARMLNRASRAMTGLTPKGTLKKVSLSGEEKQLLVKVLKAMGMLEVATKCKFFGSIKFDEKAKSQILVWCGTTCYQQM